MARNFKYEKIFINIMIKEKLLISYKIISLLIIFLICIPRANLIIMGVYFLLTLYSLLASKKTAFNYLMIASLVSIIWMFFANNQYGYNHKMLLLFGLNSFPLFAWATGLFLLYLLYSYLEIKLNLKNLITKTLFFIVLYWSVLIFAETVAYHVFNIKNVATAAYAGLPICNCLHAPPWMQISYFAIGPIYFGICKLLGLKNPIK